MILVFIMFFISFFEMLNKKNLIGEKKNLIMLFFKNYWFFQKCNNSQSRSLYFFFLKKKLSSVKLHNGNLIKVCNNWIDHKYNKRNNLLRTNFFFTNKYKTNQLIKKKIILNLKSNLKWFLKKSDTQFNIDDYSAFFSWIVLGNLLLIFLATTFCFSLIIFIANRIFAQEFIAKKIGEIITKNTDLNVTFENAIVPNWSDGKIIFKKCFVSNRIKQKENFVKSTQIDAVRKNNDIKKSIHDSGIICESNYTQFDLSIDEINVSLSFNKWFNGTGIIKTMEIKGVRGIADRSFVKYDINTDYSQSKTTYKPGDFDLEKFIVRDAVITFFPQNNFRTFNITVFNCELSRLRKNWIFLDFLNSDFISGSYDGSLFVLHKKQKKLLSSSKNDSQNLNFHTTNLRIDLLNIDNLSNGSQSPLKWIKSGRVNITCEFIIPIQKKKIFLSEFKSILSDFLDNKNKSLLNFIKKKNSCQRKSENFITLNFTLTLKNAKAYLPFRKLELSYINYALVAPIVAYINSKNTFMKIKNKIVKNIKDFEGSWSIYDSMLMDEISLEVYKNFLDHVMDHQYNLIRFKKITFWSLQLLFQLLIFTAGALT